MFYVHNLFWRRHRTPSQNIVGELHGFNTLLCKRDNCGTLLAQRFGPDLCVSSPSIAYLDDLLLCRRQVVEHIQGLTDAV